jgi:hypothetical protein
VPPKTTSDVLATFRHYAALALEAGRLKRDAAREGRQATKIELGFWLDHDRDDALREAFREYATASMRGGMTAILACVDARHMIAAELGFAAWTDDLTCPDAADPREAIALYYKQQVGDKAETDNFDSLKRAVLEEERR